MLKLNQVLSPGTVLDVDVGDKLRLNLPYGGQQLVLTVEDGVVRIDGAGIAHQPEANGRVSLYKR